MYKLIAALLASTMGTSFAACQSHIENRRNADGSSLRMIQRECEGERFRTIKVLLKAPRVAKYMTVLDVVQDSIQAPLGSAHLRDIEGDGIFEYEQRGMCGAGPNCEGTVFKLSKDRRRFYLFFDGGYFDFKYITGLYIESGRASCCEWEYHGYKAPSSERAISESDFAYSINVGGSIEREDSRTPCHISMKSDDQWVPVTPTDKHLLALCELYGPDYVVNPPLKETEQAADEEGSE
jgi:hypothetical protein